MDWNISSLLWFLGIGGLFYWMMKRGGCGMHGNHSHGSGQHGSGQHADAGGGATHDTGAVRDPVCGMQVDPQRAAGMRTVGGSNFFLCSTNCLEKFDREPERYAQQPVNTEPPESGSHAGHQRQAGCH